GWAEGKPAVTAGADATLRVWQAATGKESHAWPAHGPWGVHALALSRDGKTLASAGGDKVIRLWDPATGRERARCEGHQQAVSSVAFSPDGTTLVSGGYDGTARLWTAAGQQ